MKRASISNNFFRDDQTLHLPSNLADRMLLLDVPNQRFQMQNLAQAGAAVVTNNNAPAVNLSPSRSESGSGGGGSARLDVRAMPLPKNNGNGSSSADDSFNTERLEDQNSAENLRQSMQKYLHSKQSHLMKVSEQLAMKSSGPNSIRNSPSGLSDGSGFPDSGGGGVPATSAAQRVLFCLLYTSPSPRDRQKSRMPSSA